MDERSYPASAFHPKFEEGRASGTLIPRPESLRFLSGGDEVDLPYSGMEIRAGGASDRLLFFSHPGRPEWSIYTDDRSIVKNPHLASSPHLASALGRIRAGHRNAWLASTVVLLAIAAAIWGLFLLKDPLVGAVARRVPPAVETRVGEVALRQIALSRSTINEDDVVAPMRRLLAPIAAAAASERYAYTLNIMDDESVNAFALPGGPIVLNTGLILAAETPEEIAGVLGHEIAHITEQHSLKQIISSLGVFAIVQAMFGDISGLAALLIDGGARLVTMSFSREAELEADRVGLQYLQQAGIDPGGMVAFFRKLREKEGVAGSPGLALLSTHPATAERISSLESEVARARETTTYSALEIDLEAVQQAIRSRQNKE